MQVATHLRLTIFFLLTASCLLPACQSSETHSIRPAFYYWQSAFSLDQTKRDLLTHSQVQELYVKYFDVTWDASTLQPKPSARLNIQDQVPKNITLVPVVFITNEVLKELAMDDIPDLSKRISKLILDIHSGFSADAPGIIQIDCDWTASTKEKYFLLLESLAAFPLLKDTEWSTTIRLHQYADPINAGVPPVQRGLLMFYNMGNIIDAQTENSIYDRQTALSFLEQQTSYPLPLDVGIAVFSWGLYYHDNTLQHIFYPCPSEVEIDSLCYNAATNKYVVKQNGYFKGFYILEGDVIRTETMPPETSLESARLLAGFLQSDSISVVLYHLDSSLLQSYTYENILDIYRSFQ